MNLNCVLQEHVPGLHNGSKLQSASLSAQPLSVAICTHRPFSAHSRFRCNFPQQRPLWSVQVQTAQSCSDGHFHGNQGVFLQSHSVSQRCLRSPTLSCNVAEEKWTAGLSETSLHVDGRPLHPWPVNPKQVKVPEKKLWITYVLSCVIENQSDMCCTVCFILKIKKKISHCLCFITVHFKMCSAWLLVPRPGDAAPDHSHIL